MQHINIQYFKTPYGELILGAFANKLCLCDWRYRKMRTTIDKRICGNLQTTFVERDSAILSAVRQQLEEYFALKRAQFDLPLLMIGSDFQRSVWDQLIKLTYGKTSSYLQLAELLGKKSAVRAVAGANGANAISIIVPCHRIIGSHGELVGYAGGLTAKKKLLMLEQNILIR